MERRCSYTKALEFVSKQKGQFKQESIVKEIYDALSYNDTSYAAALINEAFNQRKMDGYKYKELCERFYVSPEFNEDLVQKYWFGFEEEEEKDEKDSSL